jgi:hypothetical protein
VVIHLHYVLEQCWRIPTSFPPRFFLSFPRIRSDGKFIFIDAATFAVLIPIHLLDSQQLPPLFCHSLPHYSDYFCFDDVTLSVSQILSSVRRRRPWHPLSTNDSHSSIIIMFNEFLVWPTQSGGLLHGSG